MVRRVATGSLTIGEDQYDRTLAITPSRILPDWPEKPIAELRAEDFADVLEAEPEILLLGTGAASVFPPRELVFGLARQNVGLEVMDTKAAARTFNVLAGEGREVAAVLYV
jgi:uncharacterized protein